jgi:uncharacterized membrane protein YgaE (UPF0421/DUF939 family)
MFRRVNPLIYVIIAFAIVGLVTSFVTNTAEFFKALLMTIGFVVLFTGIIYLIRSRSNTNEFSRKYKKAVKQSKRKYGSSNDTKQYAMAVRTQRKWKADSTRQKRRDVPHLRVIEGKKDKKKNRAFF